MKTLNKVNYNDKYGTYGGIYERVLRAKDGRLVRVHFIVSEVDGRFKGHIIAVEPVEAISSINPTNSVPARQVFLLAQPSEKSQAKKIVRAIPSTAHFSPYFSFEFFMSQPTRAPSGAPSFA